MFVLFNEPSYTRWGSRICCLSIVLLLYYSICSAVSLLAGMFTPQTHPHCAVCVTPQRKQDRQAPRLGEVFSQCTLLQDDRFKCWVDTKALYWTEYWTWKEGWHRGMDDATHPTWTIFPNIICKEQKLSKSITGSPFVTKLDAHRCCHEMAHGLIWDSDRATAVELDQF